MSLLSQVFEFFERFMGQLYRLYWYPNRIKMSTKIIPKSVNYHFTRQCNYACGFCFHTAKNSFVLPLEEAKRGLALLAAAGKCSICYHVI